MPEYVAGLFQTPGLYWIIAAVFMAGLVRGFAGFGTAMVFLPVAGQFLNPFEALAVLFVMDSIGPLPNVPRTLRDGHPPDVARLTAGLILTMPIGIFLLSSFHPDTFRMGVSGVSLILLALLVAGVRYKGAVSNLMVYGVGGLGGILGGSVGLAGPPVIMFYMASPLPPKQIRANIFLFLLVSDFVFLAAFWISGNLVYSAIGLGLSMAVPYLVANVIGAWLFRPDAEKLYRMVAYLIIATSAISGLPFWGQG